MEELTIVRKRSRVWPMLIALLVLVLIAAAVFYVMGGTAAVDEFGRAPGGGTWLPLTTGGIDGIA